jgi:PAS domain S-box-containing protein
MIDRPSPRTLGTLLATRGRLLGWSRAVVSASTSRVVGLLLICASGLALLGWMFNAARLLQPFTSFPPLRVLPALGLLFLGTGIVAVSVASWRWLAVFCASAAIVVGAIPSIAALGYIALEPLMRWIDTPQHVSWNGEPPTQVALSTSVFIVLGGIGLLAIAGRRRGLWSSVTLAASGGIVMLLAVTVVATQALGVLEGVALGPVLGSSLQSTVCALVFATHFNTLAWSKESGFAPPPAWLPLSVGAGSLVGVLFLWRALLASEKAQLVEQTRVAARSTRSSVHRQLTFAQRSMQRMANFNAVPDARWSASVTQLVQDDVGLVAVVWVDSASEQLGADLRSGDREHAIIRQSVIPHLAQLRSRGAATTFLRVRGIPEQAVMAVPHCRENRCAGLLLGVVDARQILSTVATDTILGFEMAISNGSQVLTSSDTPNSAQAVFTVVEPIIARGPAWSLQVWPSRKTAAVTPSTLSDVVLLLGIAVSVLLAVALRLAQSLATGARLQQRATFDLALQSTTDGIWEWDVPSGRVTRSPQLWHRLGYLNEPEDGQMADWLALVHPQDRSDVQSRLDDHLASREETFSATYRIKSASGRWHDFVDRGRVILRSPEGAPLRALGMYADVTDRRNATESLRQAETMSTMGRLAARIAHEINNPLAGIQSAFLLIKDSIPVAHPHFKYVGAIQREIERISQVTRQLYETYRPETEATAHAAVQTVVSDSVVFIEQVNRHSGVAIAVDLGNVAAVVRLPASMLRQCVYNLVQNAIEASPEGATVMVHGEIEGGDFVLRVVDQGLGVPAEMRDRIFEPFVSTKSSQLSTGGMGLGLSLVRRALDAAGGSIEVRDAPAGGAEFIARIPLAESQDTGASE